MASKIDTDDKAYYALTLQHVERFDNSSVFDRWDLEYIQLSEGKYDCSSQEIWLNGLQIYKEEGNLVAHEFGTAWGNFLCFCHALKNEMGMSGQWEAVVSNRRRISWRRRAKSNCKAPMLAGKLNLILKVLVETVMLYVGLAISDAVARLVYSIGI